MQKPLLTSSQVSVAVSCLIIVFCTVALFLAGYALQQETVLNLHRTLRPRAPVPRHHAFLEDNDYHPVHLALALNPVPRTKFTSRLSNPLKKLAQKMYLMEEREKQFDWSRYAHAQLVRDHEEVCDALVTFHELHRQRSSAPKLLLFPKIWLEIGESGDEAAERSIRLIRKASRLYRAILVPIGTLRAGGDELDPNAYSMASVFSLTDYDRVMMLPTPGLVLNSKPFDSMLAFFEPKAGVAVHPHTGDRIFLIQPNHTTYNNLSAGVLPASGIDFDVINHVTSNPEALLSETDPDYKPSLYVTLEDLRNLQPQNSFNATDFFEKTAFVSIQDSALPGPEWEVPYQNIVNLRPDDANQAFIWERMYSLYKSRRYTVCGLDPKPMMETGNDEANDAVEFTDEKQDL